MSYDYPTNSDDVIDSRSIIARIAELESIVSDQRNAFREACILNTDTGHWEEPETGTTYATQTEAQDAAIEVFESDEDEELTALQALADEADGSPDWEHGETLIRDSYFKTYAQELADDIGAIPDNASWPCTCIDWERAARELQMDYFSVSFDGVDYWIRS